MRAALMERGRIRVEDVPDPTPAEGEVVVKSVACGICGSDLHAARHTEEFVATSIEAGGAFKLTTFDPVVLGHEFCAEVMESHGELRAGDLVCSVPVLARPTRVPVGYSTEAPGGFGEYILLSERLLMPVPAGTSRERAALTEPMAVGYHAVNMARLSGDEAIVVIGAGPVGLAVTANLKARGAAARSIDGLILSGGDDVHPEAYGVLDEGVSVDTDLPVDLGEIELLKRAVAHLVPVLGICRGAQIVNVAYGGSLHQDMLGRSDCHPPRPEVLDEIIAHRHDLKVAPDSELSRILGVEPRQVNSTHHQAISELAPGLRAVAWAPDGIVEAIESEGPGYLVAVQWHPEKLPPPRDQELFDDLVRAATERLANAGD